MAERRVLLAWEMGGNLGHLSRLLAVARMVKEAGATPIWALPASAMASPWLAGNEDRRLQVPLPVVTPDKVDVLSYASILLNIGFANPGGVARALLAWRALVEKVQPDLVVLDSAPVAQLAACLFGWPALRLSNGFDSPPAECPTFGVGLRGPYIERLNAQHLAQLACAIQRAAQHAGFDKGPTLEGYLSSPARYFDCIAQTDPYRARDDVCYVGPLIGLPDLDAPVWPDDAAAGSLKVFAYLRGSPLSTPLLNALAEQEAAVLCVADEMTAAAGDSAARHRVRITATPVQLDTAIRQADLVVSYSPLGLVSSARMAGKPHLLAPNDIEKLMAARRLAREGAAVIVRKESEVVQGLQAARQISLRPVGPDAGSLSRLKAALGGSPITGIG